MLLKVNSIFAILGYGYMKISSKKKSAIPFLGIVTFLRLEKGSGMKMRRNPIDILTGLNLATYFVCHGNKAKYIAFSSPDGQRIFLLHRTRDPHGGSIYYMGELIVDGLYPNKYRIAYDLHTSEITRKAVKDFLKREQERKTERRKSVALDWSDIRDDAVYRLIFNDWLKEKGYTLALVKRKV